MTDLKKPFKVSLRTLTSFLLPSHCHIGRDFHFKPVSITLRWLEQSRLARRDLFRGTLVPPPKWDQTLPTAWLPDDPQRFRDKLCNQKPPPNLEDWFAFLLPLAREHAKWKEALLPGLLKRLWMHLRCTDDPLLLKAFQLRIRQLERERRDQRQRDQLLKRASGRDLRARRGPQAKHRIHVSGSLDGENNRVKLGTWLVVFWRPCSLTSSKL